MRSDPRTRGHPKLTAKYEAEGRLRPQDAFTSDRATPLHYQVHTDQRVILDASGTPALHHEALEALERRSATASTRRWLTVPEVARLLEVDPQTIRDWIEKGDLPAQQPGGPHTSYRIDTRALDATLAARGYTPDQLRDFQTTWTAWLSPPQPHDH